jgi:Polyketide cyclase / dehydrase and lipid transport
MVDFRETVTIRAGVADVVRVLLDVERWPSWTPTMSRVVRERTGPLAVGDTATVKQPRLGAARWTVTRLDDTGFEWVSSRPGARTVAGHWVSDAGDGRCEAVLTLAMSGPLARPAAALYRSLIRRYLRTEADGLRREAER